jgi:hypothetical protein
MNESSGLPFLGTHVERYLLFKNNGLLPVSRTFTTNDVHSAPVALDFRFSQVVRHEGLELILVSFSQHKILETVVVVNVFDGIDFEDRCSVSARQEPLAAGLPHFLVRKTNPKT